MNTFAIALLSAFQAGAHPRCDTQDCPLQGSSMLQRTGNVAKAAQPDEVGLVDLNDIFKLTFQDSKRATSATGACDPPSGRPQNWGPDDLSTYANCLRDNCEDQDGLWGGLSCERFLSFPGISCEVGLPHALQGFTFDNFCPATCEACAEPSPAPPAPDALLQTQSVRESMAVAEETNANNGVSEEDVVAGKASGNRTTFDDEEQQPISRSRVGARDMSGAYSLLGHNTACQPAGNWMGPRFSTEECARTCADQGGWPFFVTQPDGNCRCADCDAMIFNQPRFDLTLYRVGGPPFNEPFDLISENTDCNPSGSWLGTANSAEECYDRCKDHLFFVWAKDGDHNCKCASCNQGGMTRDERFGMAVYQVGVGQ